MRKSAKGFGVVEILLVVVIIAVLATVGWVFVSKQKTSKPVEKAATSSDATQKTDKTQSPSSQQADIYANWNTCSDPVVGVSIKYPSNWQNSTNSDENPCKQYDSASAEGLLLNIGSPKVDGKVLRVYYTPGNQYNTETISDLQTVVSIEPITTAASKSLSLVGYADQDVSGQNVISDIALTDQHFTIGQTFRGSPTISSKLAIFAFLTLDDGGEAESYTLATYQQQPSYQDLLKIFKSVIY